MVNTADTADQTVDTDADLAPVAQDAHAAESADHGGDSACWAHLVCPECGALSSEGHHEGCESEQIGLSDGSVLVDQRPISADHVEAVSNERASVLAEQRLMRRIVIWTAIGVPVGAAFFGLLVFVATLMADVPAEGPVAAGAIVGVLAGLFVGMLVGVMASVEETEHANLVLRERTNA